MDELDELYLLENPLLKLLLLNSEKSEHVSQLFDCRDEKGEFNLLFEELRDQPLKFFEYFRMTPETFEYILKGVEKNIEKFPNFRDCISPKHRLALTLRMGERRGTKALEAWCKRVTQGYHGVKVENMTTSWRDGLAFCALIHHFRPDLIDFESLNKSDVIGNNELAFRIAERHLGIPALLDAEDMAEYPVPDRLSILTYLSQFYQVFSAHSTSPVKKIPNDSDTSIASLTDVTSSPNMEGAPPWRELCLVCSHPVYLAQRLRVQGNLYHRTCFRCARCSAQLTLVDYYETHDGKFCCETCPDEVTAASDPRTSDVDLPPLEVEDSLWTKRPPPTPELSPTTRQSIVAMRRMFFDTDDAKLTRCETLCTDLHPADIPNSPNDQVKPQSVHSPVADKLSGSPTQNSVELPNTGACVEYQSDNTSPSPSRRTIVDKSNYSSLKLDDLENKPPVDSNARASKLSDTILAKPDKPPSPRYTDKIGVKVLPALPTKLVIGRTTEEKDVVDTNDKGAPNAIKADDAISGTEHEYPTSNEHDGKSVEHSEEIVAKEILVEAINSELNESKDDGSPPVSLNGNSEIIEKEVDFGEHERGKEEEIVEAVNRQLVPPSRPKRRQKSPQAHPRDRKPKPPPAEYPDDLNPFGDDEEEEAEEPSTAGTNPFGSDSEEEFESTAITSTPLTSPHKTPARPSPSTSPGNTRRMSDFSPVRKAPSLNPFEDSDDELEDDKPAIPVPLPRKAAPSPEPMPFPRNSLRGSQRSIASTISTCSRKKRPAPPPPAPPSPSATIRSTRSRKTRRAPLPPGMASSRLSLASDTISLGGYSVNESVDLPLQISAVTDRITEWVATSNLEKSYDTIPSTADSSAVSQSLAETSVSDIHLDSSSADSKLDTTPKPTASLLPVIEVVDDSVSTKQDEVENFKNECRIEEPKSTVTISGTPSSSPIKIRDLSPSDEPLDNRIDSRINANDKIENDVSKDKMHRDKLMREEENVKETEDKKKSFNESVGSEFVEHFISVSNSGELELHRSPKKTRQAPRPLEPKISITNRHSYADSDVEDKLLNNKKNKDDVNMTRKISGSSTESSSGGFSLHKSAHGQWKRKKAPAPPLPLNPDQRTVKKGIPLMKIKQELNDIEIKQQGLERQGVALEAKIRDKFDSDASITPFVEELVLQLFELVNEKNELFRKQAELMYLRRQQHLEEEQADLEKEIRALMGRPEANKTDSDKELEEQLIQRLVEVVERRDAIVQCLEMDRIREAEEDRSISAQLNVFTKAMAPEDKTSASPKKRKPHPEGNKKKWYTLSRSPKKTHS